MRHARTYRRGAILALCATTAALLAATAGAGQALHDVFGEPRQFTLPNYCGTNMTVRIDQVLDGRIQIVPHGDGVDYFMTHGKGTEVITNLANGKSITSAWTVMERDKEITVLGPGLLEIVVLATGNAVLYDANGKAIARNPGQLRYELFVAENDPSDPFDDDIEIGDVVKGSTGRSDDVCEAGVPALS